MVYKAVSVYIGLIISNLSSNQVCVLVFIGGC
ncbi:MAG: hypothetical protein ACI849_000779 [Patiriisocius sp.]